MMSIQSFSVCLTMKTLMVPINLFLVVCLANMVRIPNIIQKDLKNVQPQTPQAMPSVEFKNIICTSLDKGFSDFEYCFLKSVNRTYKYFSVKVNLFKVPITKVKVNLALYKQFNGFKPFLYNVTVDACKFLKNIKSNPVALYFYEFIRESSNMNHTCPFDHDLIVEKLTTETMNHRFTNILPFPEGYYMIQADWYAYDINRAIFQIYFKKEK